MIKMNIIRVFVCFFLLTFGFALNAQTNKQVGTSIGQPVLIDDVHADVYRQISVMLQAKNKSVLGLVSDLTAKQKKLIANIEKCYSKKWDKSRAKLDTLKAGLNEAVKAKNEKQAGMLKHKISETVIAMKKLNSKTSSRIAKQLTYNQKKELETAAKF